MAAVGDSSRIFVRNLPATLTEADFRSHFTKNQDVTDIRFFPKRRIGYVGYSSPENAKSAVRYYNKSFIRMSRIAVEMAKPIVEEQTLRPRQTAVAEESNPDDRLAIPGSRSLKRKRAADMEPVTPNDAKLKQFLGVMQATAKNQTWQNEALNQEQSAPFADGDSHSSGDEEIQSIQRRQPSHNVTLTSRTNDSTDSNDSKITALAVSAVQSAQSDQAWLQSKGIGLLRDDQADDDDAVVFETLQTDHGEMRDLVNEIDEDKHESHVDDTMIPEDTQQDSTLLLDETTSNLTRNRRLYLRNLPFTITEDQLQETFSTFGPIEEIHLPMESNKIKPKGFAFLLFKNGNDALKAYEALDGRIYQGRLLHILAAQPKREGGLDDYAISQLPLKQQTKIKRKMESSAATHKWNPLYMNMNDVMSSISDRLGIEKSDMLDATSSDAAVKQALAETHVIQEAKSFFASKGVNLDSFKPGQARGDTAILVKNFPYGTSHDEIHDLFVPYGQIKNLLIPPSGTMALVEYSLAPQGKAAFSALKYRRLKNSILFLEKAPKEVFQGAESNLSPIVPLQPTSKTARLNAGDLLQQTATEKPVEASTLFVRNLNFTTTTDVLRQAFAPLAGYATATVKTRTDSSRPGEHLSMGFGFVEFSTAEAAQAALKTMNGASLEGHVLDVRPSQRVLDHGQEQRRKDKALAAANQQTKVIIKNLPFETSKKDVRALLANYGQLRSVRVPKKFDRSARGFAFAEFTTTREAANAMEALKSTHLLGRRLHMEYAAQDSMDPEEEIEKMQQKVGAQADRVAMQKLTGAGRRKFNVEIEQTGQ